MMRSEVNRRYGWVYGPEQTMLAHWVHSLPMAVMVCQATASTSHSRTPGRRKRRAASMAASVMALATFRHSISSSVLITFARSKMLYPSTNSVRGNSSCSTLAMVGV